MLLKVNELLVGGHMSPDEITIRQITGKGLHGGKGLLHVILWKEDLKAYLLDRWGPVNKIPDHTRQKAREVFATVDSVKLYFNDDTTWMAPHRDSGELFFKLIYESVILPVPYDQSIKSAVRQGKVPEDWTEYEGPAGALTNIIDAIAAEAAQDSAAASANPAPASSTDDQTPSAIPIDTAVVSLVSAACSDDQPTDTPCVKTLFPIAVGSMAHHANRGEDAQDKYMSAIMALSESDRGLIKQAEKEASRLLRSRVKLTPPLSSEKALRAFLQSSTIGSILGDEDGYAVIWYDVKLGGESLTNPKFRCAPLRGAGTHMKSFFKSVATSRPTTPKLHYGDMYVFCDGGTLSLKDKFVKCFDDDNGKPVGRVTKDIYLHYSLESQLQRRDRLHNFTSSVMQLEGIHLLTAENNSTPVRSNLHCEGDSSGTVLGPVAAPNLNDQWSLPYGVKRDLYGKDARPDGRLECGDLSDLKKKRHDADVEPVTYWPMSPEIYRDILLRGYGKKVCKAVIDGTCTDGILAKVCIELGTPYLGIVHTERHLELLQAHLDEWMFQQFLKPKSKYYKADVAKLLADALDTVKPTPSKHKSKAKAKTKAAANRNPNAAPMPKAKASANKDSYDEDDDDDATDHDDDEDSSDS